jgi:hypothetical protein
MSISAKDLRIGLLHAGFDGRRIDETLHCMEIGTQRSEFRIAWEYQTSFDRDELFIQFLAHRLALSQAQLDEIFGA